MPLIFGGFGMVAVLLWSFLPLIALVIALRALRAAQDRSPDEESLGRLAEIEARLRALAARVSALERPAGGGSGVTAPPPPEPPQETAAASLPAEPPPLPAATPPFADAGMAPRARGLDLEQRIGARWSTWVGIVAILFAAAFFLRWAFEQNLIGPGARVILGVLAGAGFLAAGLLLHRRRDMPYLSEGLSGGGLGILYLSLYAGYAFYAFLTAGTAFVLMFLVTVTGALVAVLSDRQTTAVLTVLGGLLTPVLLASERPDERVLLGYLLVLDVLVLSVARFRTWPALNWLAWAGTALLALPSLLFEQEPLHLLTRLVVLSALFLLFLVVPLARESAEGGRRRELGLALVVANAAGYFWAVDWTLERSHQELAGPWALALALLYAAVAAAQRRRIPDDEAGSLVHLGIADVFLTLGIALAIHGPWITLGWAVQGVVLLWLAPRVGALIAAWGGLAALLLAVSRVLWVDAAWYPELVPTFTPKDLVHLAVVGCLVAGGILARRVRPDQLRLLTPDGLRSLLWIVAALVAAALSWRETTGLWPAILLAAEVLLLGALGRGLSAPRAPTFGIAAPLVGLALVLRVMVEDAALARAAAGALVNTPLLVRVAACAALGLAGRWLGRSEAEEGARSAGRVMSAAAGGLLLIVLSLGWIDNQEIPLREARGQRRADLAADIRWRVHVGLSVLWTLYAAAALGWGFLRSAAVVRYAALGLFGLTIAKVFLVDLAAVQTIYRIVSFLILGLVLLGVSFVYQRTRGGSAGTPPPTSPP